MKHWILVVLLLPIAATAQLPDDLEVGAYVEIEAEVGADSRVVATEVGIDPTPDTEDRVRGWLESRTPLVIAGVPVALAETAVPADLSGAPVDLDDVAPGTPIDARGRYVAGVLQAGWLVAYSNGSNEIDLEGTITAVDGDADTIRVLGVDVYITPDTWVELD